MLNVRKDFPILTKVHNGHPLVYLDNAATTQKPLAVLDATRNYYETQNANVHRLNYGAMRWWGSISYAAMAIGLSFVLPKLSSGVDCTFYLYFLTMIRC